MSHDIDDTSDLPNSTTPLRHAGLRAAAAVGVIALVTGMAFATWPSASTPDGTRGMSTEIYGVDAPAPVDEARRADIPAPSRESSAFEEPPLVVNHERHG